MVLDLIYCSVFRYCNAAIIGQPFLICVSNYKSDFLFVQVVNGVWMQRVCKQVNFDLQPDEIT
jgi:hypothetical protein